MNLLMTYRLLKNEVNGRYQKNLDLLDKELAIANTHFLILKELAPVVKKEIKSLNPFFDYFFFAFVAHTQSVIVCLAKFFDKRTDSKSLFTILNNTEKQKFEKRIKSLEKDFKFYEDYRNKIVAHIDIKVQKSSLTLPKINFNKLEKFIKDLEKLMVDIRKYFGLKEVWGHMFPGINDRSKNVLKYLKEYLDQRKDRFSLRPE